VDHLYLTSGSDAALRMLFQAFVRPGDRIVMADPTYAMYSLYTQIFQAVAVPINYGSNLRVDLNELIKQIRKKPRVLVWANPDQPTGAVLPMDALLQLAESTRRSGTLLIIDEAYYPFHPISAQKLVLQFEHIAILRTFSKAFGLA